MFIRNSQTNFSKPMENYSMKYAETIFLKWKYCLLLLLTAVVLGSCGGGNKGQLVGVQPREKWYQADPYGMVYIPGGSYNMGPSDQDVPYAVTAQSKTVTIPAFYMTILRLLIMNTVSLFIG